MRKFILSAMLAAVTLTTATPALADPNPNREYRRDVRKAQREYRKDIKEARRDRRDNWRDYNRYDWDRRDPRYGDYRAERYYRDDRSYKARRLSANDRVYRGGNGRYYCRRSDGTTGLIIGGLGGGVLGNVIAPGDSKTLGTILGAGAGALLGNAIDRDNVTCR